MFSVLRVYGDIPWDILQAVLPPQFFHRLMLYQLGGAMVTTIQIMVPAIALFTPHRSWPYIVIFTQFLSKIAGYCTDIDPVVDFFYLIFFPPRAVIDKAIQKRYFTMFLFMGFTVP